jgi:hypothetical protein
MHVREAEVASLRLVPFGISSEAAQRGSQWRLGKRVRCRAPHLGDGAGQVPRGRAKFGILSHVQQLASGVIRKFILPPNGIAAMSSGERVYAEGHEVLRMVTPLAEDRAGNVRERGIGSRKSRETLHIAAQAFCRRARCSRWPAATAPEKSPARAGPVSDTGRLCRSPFVAIQGTSVHCFSRKNHHTRERRAPVWTMAAGWDRVLARLLLKAHIDQDCPAPRGVFLENSAATTFSASAFFGR